jgi:peptide/nickel transport system substrate-binding protein
MSFVSFPPENIDKLGIVARMGPQFFHRYLIATALCAPFFGPNHALAEPTNGIAMYGEPALGAGDSLPYANPQAPKGGTIRMDAQGGFDSLNPWILAGRAAEGIAPFVAQSLMMRSIDEPFALYGLLAESVDTDDARSFVEFTLRDGAKFSNGAPVTVEDVLWSYEIMGTKGHPRYTNAWAKIATAEATGPRSVRFTFTEPDRELALLMGMRPILQKAQYEGKDFASATLEAPIGSGPYIVETVDPGRKITLKRNLEWWAKDLPIVQGLYNFDTLTYVYFADQDVAFEAFKAGALDTWREGNAARWMRSYTFPAVTDGRVLKTEIPNERPSGITGLVFNTRKETFADWRVREALTLVYNFEQINTTLNGGAEPRIQSYFGNSALEGGADAATGRVADLLAPFQETLIPGTVEGYAPPESDGSALNRKNTRAAMRLLNDAGWRADDRGILRDANGTEFTFEIVLQQGDTEVASIVDIYAESLKRLGITPRITLIDAAQYRERTNAYDFDMAWYSRALSLSPGNEQILYWGANGVTEPGSRNWMGMNSPAAENMVNTMLETTSAEDFTASVQALDRILTAGRYVIPNWYPKASRLAYKADLHFPDRLPLYGDWPGFQPDVWWHEAMK